MASIVAAADAFADAVDIAVPGSSQVARGMNQGIGATGTACGTIKNL